MVYGFTKSPEGVKEYQKIGKEYEDHLQDRLYDDWLRTTTAEGLENYTIHKEKELNKIHVVKVGDRGGGYADNGNNNNIKLKSKSKGSGDNAIKESNTYIMYDYSRYRLDPACNVTSRYMPRNGVYPIPRPHYKITNMDFGKQKREVDYVEMNETAYSIPWSKANIMKILKEYALPPNGKISCGIRATNGILIHVETLEDLMNATSSDELLHFGRIPTDQERQKWINELGGAPADIQKLINVKRMIEERNIPAAPVTTSNVQDIIRREINTINENQQQQKNETSKPDA